jgi:ketopantoate reductase
VHVAVVGAGALGRIYGVRLASVAKVDVAFVVRGGTSRGAMAIERVGAEALRLESPSYVAAVPPHADAVLLCVRAEQIDDALLGGLVEGPKVPVVVMTPLLPKKRAHLAAALGGRAFSAMTNAWGYANAAGVIRYWIAKTAKLLVDEPRPADPALDALLGAFCVAGFDSAFQLGVHELSAATSVAIVPLFLAIDAAGSIDALAGDKKLLKLAFDAISEGRALAERYGALPGWVRMLDRFGGPVAAKVGLALGRKRSPEMVSFVDEHFGRKIHAQNVAMGRELLELAAEKKMNAAALRLLVDRVSGQ